MPKRKKTITFKDTLHWNRISAGHYKLMGEYVVGEKEIMAEVKKKKSKWEYCLWTWGSVKPKALGFSKTNHKKARDIKKEVVELVNDEHPKI